jgi:hypothetical protein
MTCPALLIILPSLTGYQGTGTGTCSSSQPARGSCDPPRQLCFLPHTAANRHSREHQASPHAAQLGKFAPSRLQVTHTPGTRKREACSRYDSVGLISASSNTGEFMCGVDGPSDDDTDAVSSEAKDGARLTVWTEERVSVTTCEEEEETIVSLRGSSAGDVGRGDHCP